ncbi:hypothetical protein [Clostridium formicaceticum]|uniref:Uncharacterized protein n=1 Tax=Clostridium formicaceticum TaxID=1497 RepID=A0AAC9WHF9_9CLOT|nr:hypothetical protein [Clostridium formicaceticum]AOY74573.1 hypothetical protein BJL90_00540 [Clostridium formicaceticum]ARE88933.1 hypothetical protein CLFO_33390 [Clostridium formicaceticum]
MTSFEDVVITKGGGYVLTGTMTNGQVSVEVNESGVTAGGGMGGMGGRRGQWPEGEMPNEGMRRSPENMERPEGMEMPAEGMKEPRI